MLLVELVEFCEIFRLCWTKVRVSWPFGKGFESVMISSISSEGLPPGKLSEFVFGAATSSRSPAVCNVIWLVGPLLDKKRSNNSFEFPSRSSWNLQFFLFHSLFYKHNTQHIFSWQREKKKRVGVSFSKMSNAEKKIIQNKMIQKKKSQNMRLGWLKQKSEMGNRGFGTRQHSEWRRTLRLGPSPSLSWNGVGPKKNRSRMDLGENQ